MARTVTFYYDILSPFAHIALARLRELPSDVIITPKPVLLGAILSHWGQRGPAEIGPKRIHTYRQAVHLGSRYGVSLRFPPRHPFNPLAALRILAGADADLAMLGRAFDFVFGQGRAVDTAEDVIAFAQMLEVSADLAADETAKARLRTNTEEAIALGVFGVPTFAAGAELFWGVDSFDMLKDWLANETMFDGEPYAHLKAVAVGIERK